VQRGDVGEAGNVCCAGGAVIDAGAAATRGSDDAASGQLVWDSVKRAMTRLPPPRLA
jgi:hypothetical protein